jgi:hypothetical protein
MRSMREILEGQFDASGKWDRKTTPEDIKKLSVEIKKHSGGIEPMRIEWEEGSAWTVLFEPNDRGELASYRVADKYKTAVRLGFSTNLKAWYVATTN